jgi:hypothetical protein
MGLQRKLLDIPRVWEVDWAIPASEGGTRWESYGWLLEVAKSLDATDVSIVGATYDVLGRLDLAIGDQAANALRVLPHRYTIGGITVHGVSRHGSWQIRGPVLAAWPNEDVLADIEGQKPVAVAAVASWPDNVAGWRSIYLPERIGQIRTEQEAEFDTVIVAELDRRVAGVVRVAAALVNESHSVPSTHERERMAGAFVALRDAGITVDLDALRAHLMGAGWNGQLVGRVLQLAERVAGGETPHHQPVVLPP